MNRPFDNNDDMNSADFEKRLSAFSLLAPTEEYRQIPDKLPIETIALGWGRRQWITVGVFVCSIVTLAISINVFLFEDFPTETRSETIVAGVNNAPIPGNQPSPAGDLVASQRYVSGSHFIELRNPIDMSASTTTQVVAFFWYPCWPCSEFEEHLTSWESNLGDDVTLTRVPAIWSSQMRFHARAYYTAQVLGVLDRTHRLFYAAFKKDESLVTNEEELQQFFASIGISTEDFSRAYHSEATMERLRHAEAENRAYEVQGTPSIYVAGKYMVSPTGAGGFQGMLEVTDFLIKEM